MTAPTPTLVMPGGSGINSPTPGGRLEHTVAGAPQGNLERTRDTSLARRAAWHRNRRRLIAYGRWQPQPQIDPAAARAKLRQLRSDHLLSLEALAELTGQSSATIAALLYPEHSDYRSWITPATDDAIRAAHFDLDALSGNRRIRNIGTARRLQALAAAGWSLSEIARRRGTSTAALCATLRHRTITVDLAREIRDLYRDLVDQPGPSARARSHALAQGWSSPAMWDEDTIEDPHNLAATGDDTLIDPIAIERALSGDDVPLTALEQAEVVHVGTRKGLSSQDLATLLALSSRTVQRIRAQQRSNNPSARAS